MYIELKEPRNYRGEKFEAGAILHVGGDLGRRLIDAGVAAPSSEEAHDAYIKEQLQAESRPFTKMTKAELLEEASTRGIAVEGSMTKAELLDAIKAAEDA